MKKKLLYLLATTIFCFPIITNAQTPPLGAAADFVLFSTNGAVSNSGISQLTGNIGTNNGSSTAFGNVNGVMHDNDTATAHCAADLLIAYKQLNVLIPTFFPASLLGNGQILTGGIYQITGVTSLNGSLILNAQGNPNTVFIFQIQGAFSSTAASQVVLTNGAQACNVFWKIEGLVSLATGTLMKGTIIANNAAIEINTGVTLEGRAFSTTGAVTVNGIFAYIPVGCGSSLLTGPTAPVLASTACFALFSANGPVSNTGISKIKGDVGTNTGLTTGYSPLDVTGTIHPIPDVQTASAASELLNVYASLNILKYDIELLYPAQFGNNLVLTPHTYQLNGATTFTDTLYLNAAGNSNAVFVLQLNGALSTSAHAYVKLINGTKAEHVFWKVEGSVNINDYTDFKGNIICNNGAIKLSTGVILTGRALNTTGEITTDAVAVSANTTDCKPAGILLNNSSPGKIATLFPNPFLSELTIQLDDAMINNSLVFHLFSIIGELVMTVPVTQEQVTIKPALPAGIYFYQLIDKNHILQSGKLISQE